MKYEEYYMEIVSFDKTDVFAGIGDEASDEGEGTYSFGPDRGMMTVSDM